MPMQRNRNGNLPLHGLSVEKIAEKIINYFSVKYKVFITRETLNPEYSLL
jgi:hypothetical protein